jgi:hypothetical protein
MATIAVRDLVSNWKYGEGVRASCVSTRRALSIRFPGESARAFLQNLGILLISASLADMNERGVPVSTEDRRNADIADTVAESILSDFTRSIPIPAH